MRQFCNPFLSQSISMFLFLLCVMVPGMWAGEPDPKYKHRDPSTGQSLNCTMCPAGTHMTAHCTATTPTKCAPCQKEHYTARWNYLPKCLYCNNLCFHNLEVDTECSPVNNRVCRCKRGFFMSQDLCVRHRECEPGTGVQTAGTMLTNTVCQMCSEGYFSSSSSALDSCVKHQQCTNEQSVLLPGSIHHDTVCGTCEDLKQAGETFKAFISGFLKSHKMRLTKMKRLVRYINTPLRKRRMKSAVRVHKQRGPLQEQIISWLVQSPEQLKQLPLILRVSNLNQEAEALEMRLNALKEQLPDCSLTL